MSSTKTSQPHAWRNLALNMCLALGSLLFVLLAVELTMRWVLLSSLNPFEPDPTIGYRLKRSFNGAYPRTPVRTDAYGRRVPTGFDGEATGRFLFIGDSVTFGFGVLAEESFPALFAAQQAELSDATNAAVPGYNLDQALAVMHENVARRMPELVVYGVVINDIGDANDPVQYVDIDPHARRSQSGGVWNRSVLVAFVQRRWNRIAGQFATPDERTTGPRATLGDTRDFDSELDSAVVVAFDRQWQQLESFQRSSGLPIYAIVLPFRQQIEASSGLGMQRFMSRRCESSVVTCLDPLPMLLGHADEGLFNGESSYHFSPHGHRLIADWLLAEIGEGAPDFDGGSAEDAR